MIRKVKNIIKKIVFKFIKPVVQYKSLQNSYSQAGEDLILSFLFNSLGLNKPSYIDIGANRPDYSSNTYIFYLNGSRGICIEPDRNLFENFIKVRPLDLCLNIAIGYNEDTELDYYVFDEPSVNTLSFKDAKERINGGEFHHIDTIKVPVKKLEDIIKTKCEALPNFISLDIEGFDYEVLKAFDFKNYPIPVWVVETIDYSPKPQKIKNYSLVDLMILNGFFVYADTYINTIFVSSLWFHNYKK